MDKDNQGLIETPCRTYKRRWYVLCMLSLLSCIQNGVWATWGPIAQSAKLAFDWTDTTIFMLVNSGNIALIVVMIPATWLLRVKEISKQPGKCQNSELLNIHLLIFIGQSLNGVAGTIAFAGPSLLSEQWFPHNQRTTATAISLMFSSVGAALAFVVEFGMSALLTIVSLLYLPDKPPTPPSTTAAEDRIDFISSITQIKTILAYSNNLWIFDRSIWCYQCNVRCLPSSIVNIAAMPLFYEISCEAAFPVSEGITTGFLTLLQNLGGTLVLLISLVQNI
ncbi:hypothetical protein KUTeg_014322, partial [Tegillarca granosa]